MATRSNLRLKLSLRCPTVQDSPPASDDGAIDISLLLGATEITKRHRKTYTIAASSSQSLDLVSALTDAFGTALTFSTVKLILIRNKSTSATKAGKVGWTSNGVPFISAAATSPVNPVYLWVNTSGTTVTSGTGDIILVYNDDANASADIEVLILGT